MRLFSTVAVAAAILSALAANNTGKYPYSPTTTRATAVPVTASTSKLAHTHPSVKTTLRKWNESASTRPTLKENVVKPTEVFKALGVVPPFSARNETHSTSSVGTSITVRTDSERSVTRYETATKTIVSTITSCSAFVSDCTVGSVVMTIATAVASEVVSINKPIAISLSVVAQANVTVVVPDRFVIVGGGAVYFPGLCDACGHYRVVFKSYALLEYRIEACAPAERNTAIVQINGQYRYLSCSGEECSKMIIGESGASRIAVCAGNECEKNLVCQHDKQCEFAACTGECFQVQICDEAKCDAPARPALPPAPAVRGGSVVSEDVSTAAKDKVVVSSQGRVTGLVSAAASVSCISKGPEASPANPAVPAVAPTPSSGSGSVPKGAPASNQKETAAPGLEEAPAPGRKEGLGSALKIAEEAPAPGRKETAAPGLEEAPAPGRKEGLGSALKIAEEAPAPGRKETAAPGLEEAPAPGRKETAAPGLEEAPAAAKVVTGETNAPEVKTTGGQAPSSNAGPQPYPKPQELGSKNEQPRPSAGAAGKLTVGSHLVGVLVGLALVI